MTGLRPYGQAHPQCEGEHRCQKPSGRICAEQGCSEPAGTLWGPMWCPEHDEQRLNNVTAAFEAILGGTEPSRERWVCDGCMRSVTQEEIADMADGEHVICEDCLERSRP